jgi:hypothetical protein
MASNLAKSPSDKRSPYSSEASLIIDECFVLFTSEDEVILSELVLLESLTLSCTVTF